MKRAISVLGVFAALLIWGPYVVYAQKEPQPDQQTPAHGKCYGESKSAWLVGLGIEAKEPADKTAEFIASLPHSDETKNKIAESAAAMRHGKFPAAEDLGAAHYLSCAKVHSLQGIDQNKIANCLYYLRIMNSFDASKKKGETKEEALENMIKASPGATDRTKRLLQFLADRTYMASDINLEHRMAFDLCSGER